MDVRIVTAGLLEEKGAFLLGRKASGSQAGRWEFPGGKTEPGEDEREALRREFREELGVDIMVNHFFMATSFMSAGQQYELHVYFVKLVSGRPRCLEHAELAWVRPEEFGQFDFAPSDAAVAQALSRTSLGGRA